MRFSVLERALSGDPDYIRSLVGLFEHLRRDLGVNKEPALLVAGVWILMKTANDLHAGRRFIRTAYTHAREARALRRFRNRYLCFEASFADRAALLKSKVDRFDEIADKLERVNSIMAAQYRRIHAIVKCLRALNLLLGRALPHSLPGKECACL